MTVENIKETIGAVSENESGAYFSDDRVYRYLLWRSWDKNPMAMFVGLNPSTADEKENDPTIRRCISFSKSWGCGGILMTNLFAFRATKPEILRRAKHPVGEDNEAYLATAYGMSSHCVACWGVWGCHKNQDKVIYEFIPSFKCFGLTKEGYPKHPLYLKKDCKLIEYKSK